MDTSETYKLMCRKAEWAAPELFHRSIFGIHDYTFKVEGNDLLWWLPTQDQLQEMLHPEVTDWVKAVMFIDFLRGEGYPAVENSMEQLWLAFCMAEKYNKIWSGSEWKEKWR